MVAHLFPRGVGAARGPGLHPVTSVTRRGLRGRGVNEADTRLMTLRDRPRSQPNARKVLDARTPRFALRRMQPRRRSPARPPPGSWSPRVCNRVLRPLVLSLKPAHPGGHLGWFHLLQHLSHCPGPGAYAASQGPQGTGDTWVPSGAQMVVEKGPPGPSSPGASNPCSSRGLQQGASCSSRGLRPPWPFPRV